MYERKEKEDKNRLGGKGKKREAQGHSYDEGETGKIKNRRRKGTNLSRNTDMTEGTKAVGGREGVRVLSYSNAPALRCCDGCSKC